MSSPRRRMPRTRQSGRRRGEDTPPYHLRRNTGRKNPQPHAKFPRHRPAIPFCRREIPGNRRALPGIFLTTAGERQTADGDRGENPPRRPMILRNSPTNRRNLAKFPAPIPWSINDFLLIISHSNVCVFRIRASVSLAFVRNGGEGPGEEVLRHAETIGKIRAPLSQALAPFGPHGARETDALVLPAAPTRAFATTDSHG